MTEIMENSFRVGPTRDCLGADGGTPLFHHIACDPVARPEDAAALGVRLVDFDTLLRQSDFVGVNCPLSRETRHLVDAAALAKMKPTAFLINTARGPIVDEAALTEALAARRIAGAALDVF